jgi:hypothetical protein
MICRNRFREKPSSAAMSAQAAPLGERAEGLVRGEGRSEGDSFMRAIFLREREKFITYFCILRKKNHRIFKLHSRSELAAAHPEPAWGGERLRNRGVRRANRP